MTCLHQTVGTDEVVPLRAVVVHQLGRELGYEALEAFGGSGEHGRGARVQDYLVVIGRAQLGDGEPIGEFSL